MIENQWVEGGGVWKGIPRTVLLIVDIKLIRRSAYQPGVLLASDPTISALLLVPYSMEARYPTFPPVHIHRDSESFNRIHRDLESSDLPMDSHVVQHGLSFILTTNGAIDEIVVCVSPHYKLAITLLSPLFLFFQPVSSLSSNSGSRCARFFRFMSSPALHRQLCTIFESSLPSSKSTIYYEKMPVDSVGIPAETCEAKWSIRQRWEYSCKVVSHCLFDLDW